MSESEAEQSPPVYRISFDLPGLPEGEQVQVAGLGTFGNGKTYEVTEAEASNYQVRNPVNNLVRNEETGEITNQVSDGPSLAEAFEHNDGITVEVIGTEPPVVNPPPEVPTDPDEPVVNENDYDHLGGE